MPWPPASVAARCCVACAAQAWAPSRRSILSLKVLTMKSAQPESRDSAQSSSEPGPLPAPNGSSVGSVLWTVLLLAALVLVFVFMDPIMTLFFKS